LKVSLGVLRLAGQFILENYMITKAANEFADLLLKTSKDNESYASNAAIEYARTDNKTSQAQYKKYCEISEIFRQLHGEACKAMHAIEREMLAKQDKK